jgi:TetR/AcrR family transcriptional regulator, regulator of mycofactocin system
VGTSKVERREETRQRIAAAAAALFSRNGYDATSIDDIAAAAGVSRSTFFRYFGTKGEVVFGVEASYTDYVRRSVRRTEAPSPRAAAHEAAVEFAELIDADSSVMRQRVRMIIREPSLALQALRFYADWQMALDSAIRRRFNRPNVLSERLPAAVASAAHREAVVEWALREEGDLVPLVREALEGAYQEATV